MNETKHPPAGAPERPEALIDTSKMSAGRRAAMELTEAARESAHEATFVSGLFMGEFNLRKVFPFPVQTAGDREHADVFLNRLEAWLREKVTVPSDCLRVIVVTPPILSCE